MTERTAPVALHPHRNVGAGRRSLNELNTKQQEAAFALMESGLSVKGYQTARAIINLETTLGEIEKAAGEARLVRDPGLYFFTVFGDPTGDGAWGWRAEGHHVSLNFTVVNRELISPNPFFRLESSGGASRREKGIKSPVCRGRYCAPTPYKPECHAEGSDSHQCGCAFRYFDTRRP